MTEGLEEVEAAKLELGSPDNDLMYAWDDRKCAIQ